MDITPLLPPEHGSVSPLRPFQGFLATMPLGGTGPVWSKLDHRGEAAAGLKTCAPSHNAIDSVYNHSPRRSIMYEFGETQCWDLLSINQSKYPDCGFPAFFLLPIQSGCFRKGISPPRCVHCRMADLGPRGRLIFSPIIILTLHEPTFLKKGAPSFVIFPNCSLDRSFRQIPLTFPRHLSPSFSKIQLQIFFLQLAMHINGF